MDGYTTTTPAFVRTDAGVVRLDEGTELPAEVLETEIVRLVAAGVIVESSTQDGDNDDTAAGVVDESPIPEGTDDAATAPAPRRKRRGQSGTNQEG